MKKLFCALIAAALVSTTAMAADNYDTAWASGLKYLESKQADDGSWGKKGSGSVGVTALVLEALTMTPKSAEASVKDLGSMKAKAAIYIAKSQINEAGVFKGAICDVSKYANYCTSLAVMALAKYDRQKYADVISRGVAWIKQQQANKAAGYDPENHKTFGGFGYGSSTRPDLSNTWIALNALKEAGVPDNDPVWKDVQIFVKRCQNSTEVSDMESAGNDGGGRYLPADHKDSSPAGKATTPNGKTIFSSYGSMSYAMLLSYLWCDLKKDDRPVKLAVKWLDKNFTVQANTNAQDGGQQGLYYYYRVMAKALTAYGDKSFAGHEWGKQLADAIIAKQMPDGSWINPKDRWGEGDPSMVTAYSLTSLALARQSMK